LGLNRFRRVTLDDDGALPLSCSDRFISAWTGGGGASLFLYFPCFLYLLNFPSRILYTFLMDSLGDLGRTLLFFGGLLVVLGALFYFSGKLPLRLGRLPGDIVHRGEHTTFYFPIVTCLVLSVVLSFLLWLFSHFRR